MIGALFIRFSPSPSSPRSASARASAASGSTQTTPRLAPRTRSPAAWRAARGRHDLLLPISWGAARPRSPRRPPPGTRSPGRRSTRRESPREKPPDLLVPPRFEHLADSPCDPSIEIRAAPGERRPSRRGIAPPRRPAPGSARRGGPSRLEEDLESAQDVAQVAGRDPRGGRGVVHREQARARSRDRRSPQRASARRALRIDGLARREAVEQRRDVEAAPAADDRQAAAARRSSSTIARASRAQRPAENVSSGSATSIRWYGTSRRALGDGFAVPMSKPR